VLARGALAAGAYRLLQRIAVHVHAAADGSRCRSGCRLSWHSRLAPSSATLNVGDHGAEDGPGGGAGFALRQRRDAGLDVGRQHFERADVQLLAASSTCLRSTSMCGRQFTEILRSRTTFCQCLDSSRMASANCAGVLPTGTMPST